MSVPSSRFRVPVIAYMIIMNVSSASPCSSLISFCHVSRPISVTYILYLSVVVRCGSKNGHQENMCLEEIGLRTQLFFSILGLIVNMYGSLYMII